MRFLLAFVLVIFNAYSATAIVGGPGHAITIRTEARAHPPYSGSTYFIYERDGQVICTKVSTCNKYDDCTTKYHRGVFLVAGDGREAESTSGPTLISESKLKKHLCLTKFKLL